MTVFESMSRIKYLFIRQRMTVSIANPHNESFLIIYSGDACKLLNISLRELNVTICNNKSIRLMIFRKVSSNSELTYNALIDDGVCVKIYVPSH